MKIASIPTSNNEIITMTNGSTSTQYIRLYIINGGKLRLDVLDGSNQWILITNANPFTVNQWAHIAIVQDGNIPVLYVNGVAPAQTFTIVADKSYWFNNFTGLTKGTIASVIT